MSIHDDVETNMSLKDNADTKNISSRNNELIHKIRSEERIYYPSSRKWKLVLWLSIAMFSVFVFSLTSDKENISKQNLELIFIPSFLLIFSILISWYKQNKNAFSIRLNAYGMMVTDFHNRTWYPWHHIDNFHTRYYRESKRVLFDTRNQKNRDTFDDIFELDFTRLPKNYEISPDEMVGMMNNFKQQYEILELHKYPELEQDAKENPVSTIDILWGRLGAKSKP